VGLALTLALIGGCWRRSEQYLRYGGLVEIGHYL
jgi:hypothetical protein